jgi:hypothetical protein
MVVTMLRQCLPTFQEKSTRLFTSNGFSPVRNFRHFVHRWLVNGIIQRSISQDHNSSSSRTTDSTQAKATRKPRIKFSPEILQSRKYWSLYGFIPVPREQKLEMWKALGPPPLSEYRLTFGKHRGKLLEEVPDSYMVKYLMLKGGRLECPIVEEAVEDYMKRHPEIKSQAGREKTRPIKGLFK